MTIKISHSDLIEELVIDTDHGKVKVSVNSLTGSLKIQGEEILPKLGMTVNDALALFLDQAASGDTKKKYATYLNRTGQEKKENKW